MSFIDLILAILLILFFLIPWRERNRFLRQRSGLIRELERKRKSRVISMVHRFEGPGLASLFSPMIDMDDAERIIEAIRLTPPEMPIDIVLHTPGGVVLATEQIARALKKHPGKVSVFVPFIAMSGGTLIALAADEIHAGENAVFGPLDPSVGFFFQAASVIKAAEAKGAENLDDRTLIMLDSAKKAMEQLKSLVHDLLLDKMTESKATEIAATLTDGRWTHDYPLTLQRMESLGIAIDGQVPDEAVRIARSSLRQASIPSVEFTPERFS